MRNIRHRGPLLAGGWLALLLAILVVVPASPAFAHAALIATEPSDNAVLSSAPAQFSLQFSEPVSPLVLTLVRPDGTPTTLSSYRLDGQTVEIDAPGPLAKGTHVLSWRVISADGHPVNGSILFSIGAPSAAPAVTEAIDLPLRAAIWIGRVLLYAGLFLGVGGAFAMAWLTRTREGEGFVIGALICGLAAAPVSLGLQGLDALGAPLSHFGDANVWRTAAARPMAGRCWSRSRHSASACWRSCCRAISPGRFPWPALPASARRSPPVAMRAPPRRNG